mgnify:FL=1
MNCKIKNVNYQKKVKILLTEYSIVFKSKKIDVGLFYIPIILIFVPIIAAELTNEYFIAFITCITIIFSILIINKIPVELKPEMHIDILVLLNEEWMPIELKYVTKKLNKGTKKGR